MKALVTGGTGFIGKHTVNALKEQGHEVGILSRKEVTVEGVAVHVADLSDSEAVIKIAKEYDTIFHLAGMLGTDHLAEGGFERLRQAVDVNISGSLAIFEAAKQSGAAVVHSGLIPDWPTPYMITKKAVAKFGQLYAKEYDTDIRTLEFPHVYGPSQRAEPVKKAIPQFILNALHNEPITMFGDGSAYMNCLYVQDAVKAMIDAATCKAMKGAVCVVPGPDSVTVKELAEKIIALTNSKSTVELKPMRAGEPQQHDVYKDVSAEEWKKFHEWVPSVSLDEGLKKTIEWFEKEQ